MEVTALCIRLLINVAVLLPAQVQHSYSHRAEATFPRIVPSRLQFFEYEPFSVNCKDFSHDLTKWTVMRNIKGTNTTCKDESETRGTYNITNAFPMDSGEYWCEVDGKKSNKVNIIVTEGSVILDSPAPPVMEGDNVTLRCRNKETFNIEADFYKNGVLMWRSSTVEMTIRSVSKSDEGLYQCKMSGIGESAESWLAVKPYQEETPLPQSRPSRVFILLCTVITILLVALLLLLVVGLHYMKQRGSTTSHPSFPMSSPLQTEASVGGQQLATYAVVTKPRAEKDEDESLTTPTYYTLSIVIGPGVSSSAATPVPSASINQLLKEDDRFYYSFN
ncbi:uncharacterized protein LOC127360704 [Dicentrarchus labrax]|uniref:uncharacterized protein LOC127360704 n=1 Tax=Dicentrarchus labrax TaxID=13489 RepID=UPI0021F5D190|nr:uncharacterized protein LOC127360704 [Dicentrarchus labrax]